MSDKGNQNANQDNGRSLSAENDNEIAAMPSGGNSSSAVLSSSVSASLMLPRGEMKKLVRVLRNSAVSNRRSVFMTLDLGDMGEVKLDVRLQGKKIFINAKVATQAAGAAMAYAIGELKEKLKECGLVLEEFKIENVTRRTFSDNTKRKNDECSMRILAR